MSAFFCDECKEDMKFDHTDYYDFDIYKCPKCGREVSMPADGYGAQEDYDYEDDEEDFGYDDDEPKEEWIGIMDDDPPGHEGFYMDVDGEPVHMLADPNMSPETAEALAKLVRHVRKLLDEGWRPGKKK